MIDGKIKEIFADCEDYKLKSINNDENKIIIEYEKIEEPLTEDRLISLFSALEEEEEALEEAEEEYNDYNRRVEEFRYCGYNEEDPDFHGMCLHLNDLDDNVSETIDTIEKINKQIRKYDDEMIRKITEEYGFSY